MTAYTDCRAIHKAKRETMIEAAAIVSRCCEADAKTKGARALASTIRRCMAIWLAAQDAMNDPDNGGAL